MVNDHEIIEAVKKALEEKSKYTEPSISEASKHISNFIEAGLSGELTGKPWSKRYSEMQGEYLLRYLKEAQQLGFEKNPLAAYIISKTLNYRQNGYSEKHCRMSAIISFVKYFIKEGLLPKSKLEEIYEVKPKRNKPPKRKSIKQDEVNKIIESVSKCKFTSCYDKKLLITAIESANNLGIRIGELCKIQINHIDFQTRELSIPEAKGNREFTKGFNLKVHTLWQEWIALRPKTESLNLFVLENGKPLTRDTLIQRFRRVSKKLGIDASFHSFRRKYISELLQSGKSLVDVSLAVNHASPRMTEQYLIPDIRRSIENQKTW
jgi:site-specific recombinase XerC